MAKSVATIGVSVTAKVSKFLKGMRRALKSLKTFTVGVRNMASRVGKMTIAIVAAGVALAGFLIKKQLKAVDRLKKMSDAINITTEDLAGLQLAARLAGASNEALAKGLKRMTRSVGEVSLGTSEASDAFTFLRLNIDDLLKMNAGDQFRTIADRISRVASASRQASLASDIFGRAGVDLLNIINSGNKALQQAADDAKQFGLAIGRVDARKIENANDAFERLKSLLDGISRVAATLVSPFLEALSQGFVNAARESRGMSLVVLDSFKTIGLAIAGAVEQLNDLRIAMLEVGIIAKTLLISFQNTLFGKTNFGPIPSSRGTDDPSILRQEDDLFALADKLANIKKTSGTLAGKVISFIDRIQREAEQRAIRIEVASTFNKALKPFAEIIEDLAVKRLPGGGGSIGDLALGIKRSAGNIVVEDKSAAAIMMQLLGVAKEQLLKSSGLVAQ